MSIWYSLTDWKVVPPGPREFVGLDNYIERCSSDQFFRDAVWVSVQLTVGPVLGALVLGAAFAVLLDRKFFGQGVVRTLLITPFLLMPVVVGPDLEEPDVPRPLRRPQLGDRAARRRRRSSSSRATRRCRSRSCSIWQWTPFMMLIMLAGLQSQPADVLEAAKVDGDDAVGHLPPAHAPATCGRTWSWASCSAPST